ncbi:MAG: hypothetical protein KDD52_09340 [Bdellovibrionales bacterium]|nr:hypothetical protein [Bdellovibrionales bacterium]
MQQWIQDVFSMPLFPHLYMIPLTFIVGMAAGYHLRGQAEEEELLPPKPE